MLFMRIWQAVNLENIKQQLIIVGQTTGDCGNCRELGIRYQDAKSCPSCNAKFQFITSREAVGSTKKMGGAVKRIKDRRPDLTFIDYDDYQSLTGKQSARDFFND